jgi:hypothetical protein
MIEPSDVDSQIRSDALLQQLQIAIECMGLLTEILVIFNGKRETLEERKIKDIFHGLGVAICRFLEKLYLLTMSRSFLDDEKIVASSNLFGEIKMSANELLKIARYDLNFLEQYFEYDYCARLNSESQFVERIENLTATL